MPSNQSAVWLLKAQLRQQSQWQGVNTSWRITHGLYVFNNIFLFNLNTPDYHGVRGIGLYGHFLFDYRRKFNGFQWRMIISQAWLEFRKYPVVSTVFPSSNMPLRRPEAILCRSTFSLHQHSFIFITAAQLQSGGSVLHQVVYNYSFENFSDRSWSCNRESGC